MAQIYGDGVSVASTGRRLSSSYADDQTSLDELELAELQPALVVERPKRGGAMRVPLPALGRDPRIDFFRGVALLVMVVDHNEQLLGTTLLSLVTYAPIGVTTAAAAFFFLSGLVLALAGLPILEQRGLLMLQVRCLHRAWQLYLMQFFALVACAALVTLLPAWMGRPPLVPPPFEITNSFLARFATFRTAVTYFDILPIYIMLLAFAPALMALVARRPAMAWGASFALYAVVQAYWVAGRAHELPLAQASFYQPLAWQFMFASGIIAGVGRRQGWLRLRLSRTHLVALLAALVIVGVWYKWARLNALTGWFHPVAWASGQPVPYDVPGIDKPTLGPVRYLHFLAVAAVMAALIPAAARWLDRPWSRAVRMCGRHSLEVFIAGVILNYACLALAPPGGVSRPLMLAMDFAVLLLSLAVAYTVEVVRRQPWRPAKSGQDSPRGYRVGAGA